MELRIYGVSDDTVIVAFDDDPPPGWEHLDEIPLDDGAARFVVENGLGEAAAIDVRYGDGDDPGWSVRVANASPDPDEYELPVDVTIFVPYDVPYSVGAEVVLDPTHSWRVTSPETDLDVDARTVTTPWWPRDPFAFAVAGRE